jgi:hypothetical protein
MTTRIDMWSLTRQLPPNERGLTSPTTEVVGRIEHAAATSRTTASE